MVLAALALSLALSACGQTDGGDWKGKAAPTAPAADSAEAGYVAPPDIVRTVRGAQGVVLQGRAAPRATVRLGAPTGETLTAAADERGEWRVVVPDGPARVFGLSMTTAGRTVQAQGYAFIAQDGRAALLAAGGGSIVAESGGRGLAGGPPTVTALDYDSQGGAVVSGAGQPGGEVAARLGRLPAGRTTAGADARYALSVTQPLTPGRHDLLVEGAGGSVRRVLDIAAPGPLSAGPVRTSRMPDGWRIDWMTPGGGVQTTLIFDAEAGA